MVHILCGPLVFVIENMCMQVCHANPSERARFIRCIYNLLNSSSPAVRYEAAGTLVTLSSAPTAVKVGVMHHIALIVCLLLRTVSPLNMAELIEVLFRVLSR